MKSYLTILEESCTSFFTKWKSLFLISLMDIFFFLASTFTYYILWTKAMSYIDKIMGLMSVTDVGQFAEAQSQSELAALATNATDFMYYYRQITYLVAIFLGLLLVYWIIFNGIAWYITNHVSKNKSLKFIHYMKRFIPLSVTWWAGAVMLMGLSIKLSRDASFSAVPAYNAIIYKTILMILGFILVSVIYMSYVLITHNKLHHIYRDAFKIFFKRADIVIPAFATMIIILLGEYLIFIKTLYLINPIFSFLIWIILIFPTIAWMRFYSISVVNHIKGLELD